MKWRHWAVLIVLVLLNYIIFSTAFTQLAEQRRPKGRATRTPCPTFESVESTPVSWIVLPTSTPLPTRTPITPSPTAMATSAVEITGTAQVTLTVEVSATVEPAATIAPSPASDTPVPTNRPATATAAADAVVHTIKRGETLSQIAQDYGVTVKAIVDANGLKNPSLIVTGQKLIIPAPGQTPPTATPGAKPSNTPKPAQPQPTAKPTQQPATATPTTPAGSLQFTGEVVWEPLVAPNCSGPAISKQSVIKDAAGVPVNGARVQVDCYGNKWLSHPSGNPGEYDAGHYDFSFGQSSPQAWTCTARVYDLNGQPVTSSQELTIYFDTNDCKPYGSGHQVAIVNWTKHW